MKHGVAARKAMPPRPGQGEQCGAVRGAVRAAARGAVRAVVPSVALRSAVVAAALLGALPAAQAQTVVETDSAAKRCLSPLPGAPVEPLYPDAAFDQRRAGRVKVQLAFANAAQAPQVTVLERLGDAEFEAAVRAHAAQLRVPCLAAGTSATFAFDFVFEPERREVRLDSLEDVARTRAQRLFACHTHVRGEKGPSYPRLANMQGVQGRVLTELRFDAPDQPPKVRLASLGGLRGLEEAVSDWLQGVRLPCMAGEPVELDMTFAFTIEGDRYGFNRDLGLRHLIAAMRAEDRARMPQDTRQMGCPFDVEFTYRQPFKPNAVVTLGAHDPARRPVAEWLEAARFELPKANLLSVFGDTARVTVPCIKPA